MAFPTAVNDQITDETTQSNVTNVAQAPAVAMGSLYQTMALAAGIAAENQVNAQQQASIVSDAATTLAVNTILGSHSGLGS
jgi:ABC-type transport system involved in cytochrome bd biosynthesis fused ATPase/permease subunit